MSFGREMKDFIDGYKAGESILESRARRKLSDLEYEKKRLPTDAEINAQPGVGGGSGAIPETSGGGSGKVDNDTGQIAGQLKGDLMRDFKLSDIEAGGIVASLAAETGGFKNLQEISPTVKGSRGGYGYAQWTGPRRVAFENFAKEQGLDPNSYAANYGFLKQELQGPEGKILEALKGAKDVRDATRIFTGSAESGQGFLRPGVVNMAGRYGWADKIASIDPIKRDYGPQVAEAPEDVQTRVAKAKEGKEEPAVASTEEKPEQSADATPLSPEAGVAIPEPVQTASLAAPVIQPEEEWLNGTMFAATGGVIPEPQRYADGGVVNPNNPSATNGVDKYSRYRSYTQQITPSSPSSFTPRRVGQPASGGATAQPLKMTDGMSPSQLAYKQATDKLAAARAAAAAKPAPVQQTVAPAQRPQPPQLPSPYSDAGYYAGNATRGRGTVPRQSAAWQNYERQLSAWKAANPTARFAEGGAIPEVGFQQGGRVTKEEFDRMVREEERRGSAGRSTGDTARDAVARRLNIKQRGISSTAYGESDYWHEPARRRPSREKTGSTGPKLPKKAPRPEPRPDTDTTESTTPQDFTVPFDPLTGVPPDLQHKVPYEQRKPEPQQNVPYEQRKPEPTRYVPYEQRKPELTRQYPQGERDVDARPVLAPDQIPTGDPNVGGRGVLPDKPPVPTTDPQAVLGNPTAAQSVSRNFRPGRPVTGPDQARFYDPKGNPLPLDANGEPVPPRNLRPIFDPQGHITGYEVVGENRGPVMRGTGGGPDITGTGPYRAAPGYARGGAIPEAGEVGGMQQAESAPDAGMQDQERHRYKPTPMLLDHVAQALDGGVKFLTRAFGLGQEGAVPTPEGRQASEDGARRFAEGEGAATPEEIQGIDDHVDPDRQMIEGDRQMQRLAKTVQWYLSQGRKDEAGAAAAGLMQYGAQKFSQLGSLAAAGYRRYQQTGDPADLEKTTRLLSQAYELIPDGGSADISIDKDTHQLMITKVDENGEESTVPITAAQLGQVIGGVQNKSLYWQQIMSLADPVGYHAKQQREASSEEWTRQHEITHGEELGKEEREAQRDLEKTEREAAAKEAEHKRGLQEEIEKEKRASERDIEKEKRANTEEERRALRNAAIDRAKELAKTEKDVNWDKVNPLMGAAWDAEQSGDQGQIDQAMSRLWDSLPEEKRPELFKGLGYDRSTFKYVGPVAKELTATGDTPPTDYPGRQAGDVVKKGKDREGNPIWVVTRNGQNFAIPSS